MKRYIIVLCMIILLAIGASAATVYVSDGASGSGASAASPFGSLTDAYNALGQNGGDIVIVGTVTVPLNKGGTTRTAFVEPAHSGKITVSGQDSSSVLLFSGVYDYIISGETEIKNLTISSGSYTSGLNIAARGYHLTMGEGLTMHSTGKVSGQVGTKIYLMGGFLPNATFSGYLESSTHLTVKSGTYWGVFGFNRGINVISKGVAKIEIGGDVSTHYLIAGSTGNSNFDYPAGAEIHVIGDLKITQQISLGNQNQQPRYFDTTLVLHGGDYQMLGTYIDYLERKRLSNLSIYVDETSDEALGAYIANFAGYGDKEGTLADFCVDVLGAHAKTNGVCAYCGEKVAPCTAHTYKSTTNGSVVTNICQICGIKYKSTTKTALESDVYTAKIGDVRVQILSDGIVRIEEKYNGDFVDGATLVVPDRTAFKGTALAYDSDDETLILSTEKYVVNIPKTNAKFSDVCIFAPNGEMLYSFFETAKGAFYSSLPAPAETPNAYALIDNGIITPNGGLTYTGSTDDTSDFERSENADVYVMLPLGDAVSLRTQFITVTGPTNLSSIKTLGSWYSKWTSYSAKEKLALIDEFRSRDVPLDVMVIDTEWKNTSQNGNDGDGTGYGVNTDLYPDMEGFLSDAEKEGVYILFNDHTHNTSLQITNPEELKWQSEGILSLIKMGLDGWWYDRNWSYTVKSPYLDVLYSTIGQVLYNDTMAKYHGENGNNRVLMLSNADWIRHGHITSDPSLISHRYGTQWSGDIYGDAGQLKREISNMVTAGVNGGTPYLSSDLGGFWDNSTISENHFLRWMQYGAFSPVYRPHSTLSSKNEHLPWSYSEESGEIVKDFLHMRYHLMPTYYALARENHDTGMPLMRRLDFYYPSYAESQDTTQYLLGRDILVAPFYGTTGDGRDVVPAEWLTTAEGNAGLFAQYYQTDSSMNREDYYSGTPKYTEIVPNIDYYWYTNSDAMPGSPAPGVNHEYFAARFSGKITPAFDCYIGVLADDAARIYINGQTHVGWKSGQLYPNLNTTTVLKAGVTYDIVVDCYEKTGKSGCYLVCEPAIEQNMSERTVFIPDGTWINVFSGEKVSGPKTVTVRGGIDEIPVFVRVGAAVLTSDVTSPLTGADWQKLSVNIYGLSETQVTLYEDDGESEDYLNGKYRTTDIEVKKDGENWTVNVGAAKGDFDTDYTSRKLLLRIHSATPITAIANGENLAVAAYEADESALPFANSGASNISSVYEIKLEVSLANGATVSLINAAHGDVNGDGKIEVYDAIAAIKAVINHTDCPAADMDGDGIITLLDVLRILKLTVA